MNNSTGSSRVRPESERTKCENCGVPEPFDYEWEAVEEGGRPDLCWGDPIVCAQYASGELDPSDPHAKPKTIHEARPEAIAKAFHEAYERLAPDFGYKTREASAVPWGDVPEANRKLMIAVATELLDEAVIA